MPVSQLWLEPLSPLEVDLTRENLKGPKFCSLGLIYDSNLYSLVLYLWVVVG